MHGCNFCSSSVAHPYLIVQIIGIFETRILASNLVLALKSFWLLQLFLALIKFSLQEKLWSVVEAIREKCKR